MRRSSGRPVVPRTLVRGLSRLRVIAALALLLAVPAQAYASAQSSTCSWGDDLPAAAHGHEGSVASAGPTAAAHLPTMSADHRHDLDGTGETAAIATPPCSGSALVGGAAVPAIPSSTCQYTWTPAPPPEDPAAGDLFHPPRLS